MLYRFTTIVMKIQFTKWFKSETRRKTLLLSHNINFCQNLHIWFANYANKKPSNCKKLINVKSLYINSFITEFKCVWFKLVLQNTTANKAIADWSFSGIYWIKRSAWPLDLHWITMTTTICKNVIKWIVQKKYKNCSIWQYITRKIT